jgi:hypothetical protein
LKVLSSQSWDEASHRLYTEPVDVVFTYALSECHETREAIAPNSRALVMVQPSGENTHRGNFPAGFVATIAPPFSVRSIQALFAPPTLAQVFCEEFAHTVIGPGTYASLGTPSTPGF